MNSSAVKHRLGTCPECLPPNERRGKPPKIEHVISRQRDGNSVVFRFGCNYGHSWLITVDTTAAACERLMRSNSLEPVNEFANG